MLARQPPKGSTVDFAQQHRQPHGHEQCKRDSCSLRSTCHKQHEGDVRSGRPHPADARVTQQPLMRLTSWAYNCSAGSSCPGVEPCLHHFREGTGSRPSAGQGYQLLLNHSHLLIDAAQGMAWCKVCGWLHHISGLCHCQIWNWIMACMDPCTAGL
jgi:hypothetical protein